MSDIVAMELRAKFGHVGMGHRVLPTDGKVSSPPLLPPPLPLVFSLDDTCREEGHISVYLSIYLSIFIYLSSFSLCLSLSLFLLLSRSFSLPLSPSLSISGKSPEIQLTNWTGFGRGR